MFEHIEFPYPEFKEWLEHCYDKELNCRDTLEVKVRIMKGFCDLIHSQYRIDRISNIDKEQMLTYVRHLEDKGNAHETIKLCVRVMHHFWRWCLAMGYKEQPLPIIGREDHVLKGKAPKLKAVLTPESIFAARTSGYGTLLQAAAFETMLSCGARIGETIQLRANDISWGKIPIDKELQCPSPYVVGTVEFRPTRHVVKTRAAKRGYISHIAGKLLKRWMELRRIPLDSNLPIFPVSEDWGQAAMKRFAIKTGLKIQIIQPYLNDDSAYDVDQMAAMEDIDIKSVEDDLMRIMILRHKRKEAAKRRLTGIRRVGKKAEKTERVERKGLLNPHLMRYTYIGYMWYRTFTGERQNDFAIQLTSGHKVNAILRSYLVENDLVRNDVMWKTLWLGKPDHWVNLLKTNATDRELSSGQTHQQGYVHRWGKAQ